jgi:hypothetical protein
MEKDKKEINETKPGESVQADEKKPHSSAFREPKEMEKKSTFNPEEETNLDQPSPATMPEGD